MPKKARNLVRIFFKNANNFNMDTQKKQRALKVFILLLVGTLIGAVNGFFGGGGGMICVPILLAVGLSNQKAHATAILTMLPISIASVIVYYSSGAINWEYFLWLAIGSVIGGILGALLLKKLSNVALQFIFAVLIILVGIRMFF